MPDATLPKDLNFNGEIGARVRSIRQQRKWTQTELGRRCFLTKENVSKIERGGVTSPVAVWALAHALKVDLDWLLNGTGTPEMKWPEAIPDDVLALADRLRKLSPAVRKGIASLLDALEPSQPDKVEPRLRLVEASTEQVPVRYTVDLAAGAPISADRQAEELDVPKSLMRPNRAYEVTRARGNSMDAIGIKSGDLVLVENVRETCNYSVGNIVVFQLDDGPMPEGAIKRYVGHHGSERRFVPMSTDPRHEELAFPDSSCRIVGVVVARQDGDDWVDIPRSA